MTDNEYGHECPTCGQWVEPEYTREQIAKMRERLLEYGRYAVNRRESSVQGWKRAVTRRLADYPTDDAARRG